MNSLIQSTFKYLDKTMFHPPYKSLVRPHVEYASPVWTSTYMMDVDCIEGV